MNSYRKINLKKLRPQHKFALVICGFMAFMLFGYGISGPGFARSEWRLGLFPFTFLVLAFYKARLDRNCILNGNHTLGSVEDASSEYIVRFEIDDQKHEIKIAKTHVLFPFKYYKPEELVETPEVNIYLLRQGSKEQVTILEQSFWEIDRG
jgi:hypothetical protein